MGNRQQSINVCGGPEIWLLCGRGLVYLSTPKAACTSIKAALQRRWREDTGMQNERPPVIQRQLAIEMTNMFRFSFVRNPWDRLVALWANKIENQRAQRAESSDFTGLATSLSFAQFVRRCLAGPPHCGNQHVVPYSTILYWQGQCVADFVGRFERLQEDWAKLDARFRLGPLPALNASRRRPYREMYDSHLRDLVGRFYARDIELFGYTF